MFTTLAKRVREVLVPFSLQDIEGFPFEQYSDQLSAYYEEESWFNGTALNNQPQSQGAQIDLYPLRINPIVGTVYKHAYALFGEPEDDGRLQVWPKFLADNDTQKSQAQDCEKALNQVWWENNGRALLMENAILSQIHGGCVFKATYVPWESKEKADGWRAVPIRIESVRSCDFVGVPDAGDYYRLSQAWFIREIPRSEAYRWGYKGDDISTWLVERYDPLRMDVWINNKPAIFTDYGGEKYPLSGENPFGLIAAVYIPHIRVGAFEGVNAIDTLKGLVKEYNLRFADYGDAVNDDSHSYPAYRNVSGSPQLKTIAEGVKAFDLGGTPNIGTNESQPDMFEVRDQRASPAMQSLLVEIVKEYRRNSFIPAVADGEDEGSQRSSLTLATRFWPLTSHVGMERIFWSAGLDVFQSCLLKIMSTKNISGITEAHTQLRMKQKWAPILPRDREVDVQEWVQRVSANLGSIEHLLELTGDIEDIEEERARILKWLSDLEDVKAKVANKYALQLQQEAEDAESKMQEDQLTSQEKVAKTQAASFQNRPAPQRGGAK